MKKLFKRFLLLIISLFFQLSCGLDNVYFIDNIPQSDIKDVHYATIRLPGSSIEGYNTYFDNFVIFYRIYISDFGNASIPVTQASQRLEISSELNRNFNSIEPRTDPTSQKIYTDNLENYFSSNYKFFKFSLEGANISNFLGSSSLGKTLIFDFSEFSPPTKPKLYFSGTDSESGFALVRATQATGIPNFIPKPDELFLFNYPELYSNANAISTVNADVSGDNNQSSAHTYVMIYIAASGTSLEIPPTTIFSQPTFVGIFKLPSPY